jgi:hypothetical protein
MRELQERFTARAAWVESAMRVGEDEKVKQRRSRRKRTIKEKRKIRQTKTPHNEPIMVIRLDTSCSSLVGLVKFVDLEIILHLI